jgi:heptosyltransferase-2
LGYPVLLGGGGEQALGGAVLASSGAAGANLAGRTSILETAAVLQLAAALVSNDSAPLHLATAVGTPAVALFGPTVPGFGFYPLGPSDAFLEVPMDCRPCSLHGDRECRRRERQCLTEITPEDVLSRLRQQVPQGRTTALTAR